MTRKAGLVVLALWVAPLPAAAQGIPVIDISNVLQQTLDTVNTILQYEQQIEQYQTQLEELTTSLRQLDAMTGVSGIGGLLNGPAQQQQRRYLPGTWEETLAVLEAGGNPGSLEDVRRVYAEREQAYKIATASEVGLLGPDDPTALAHERNRQSTLASNAVAEAAYARAQDRVDQYELLMRQIEQAPTSKVTLDLANRIAAENGLTSNELVRLLSSQLATQSAERTQDLVSRTKMEARFGQAESVVTTVAGRLGAPASPLIASNGGF